MRYEEFVIEGRNAVIEAFRAGKTVDKLFVLEHCKEGSMNTVLREAKKHDTIINYVKKERLDQMSETGKHQGVIAYIAAFEYATVDDILKKAEDKGEPPFVVILDDIEDPHNLGSIMRTADAAGVHGIIIPKRRAVQLTSVVAKTSTGAIEHVPVVRVTNLVQTVKELKEQGVWIFGTDMKGTDFRKWSAKGATALVIGNEGKGISPLLKKTCDEMLTIPMVGHVQSLNASVAASLLIYQGFTSRGN